MGVFKNFRVDDSSYEIIRKLWREGLDLDEDLKESEIVNYILAKHLPTTDIREVVENRRKRWANRKN